MSDSGEWIGGLHWVARSNDFLAYGAQSWCSAIEAAAFLSLGDEHFDIDEATQISTGCLVA